MYFHHYSNTRYRPIFFTIGITLIFNIPSGAGQTVESQNSQEETESIGWDKIIALIGATGVISAVGTGFFNRYNTNKQLEKQQINTLKQIEKQQENALSILGAQLQNSLEQMKYDMRVKELQEKLNLYSAFSFNLKRLRELLTKEQLSNNVISQTELNSIQREVDLLIGPKFYLLGPEVVRGWLEINRNYENLTSIQNLIDKIVLEYNTIILVKYKQLTGSELPFLQD